MKRFLLRIDGHPTLGNCELFQNFLKLPIVGMTSGDKKDNTIIRCDSELSIGDVGTPTLSVASSAASIYLKPVIDSLSDVTATIFSRSPKSVPEEFIKSRKDVKMVRSHLSNLEGLFNRRVMGHQPAIIEGMKEIASNFDELSSSIDLSLNLNGNSSSNYPDGITPPFVKSMLSRVSATMTQCAHLLDKSLDDQEVNLLAVLLEYTQYCDSALEIIEMRDVRQVEVEELSKLVEGYTREIEELEGKQPSNEPEPSDPNSTADSEKSSSSLSLPTSTPAAPKGFFDFIGSKWDSWNGVDPITARKNRLQKCQTRLNQTQTVLRTSAHLSSRADGALSEEISIFLNLLKVELGREFVNHGNTQVRYHETNLVYWRDFLAWLDNPPKHL